MKKNNKLQLNKQVISNLEQNNIVGGEGTLTILETIIRITKAAKCTKLCATANNNCSYQQGVCSMGGSCARCQ